MSYDPQFREFVRQAMEAAQRGQVSGLEQYPGQVNGFDIVGNLQYPGQVNGFDIVGADALKAAMVQNLMPAARPVAMPPPGVYSTSEGARIPRRKVLGFPLVTIALGATLPAAQPQVIPQEAIRPERLIIEDVGTGAIFDLLVDDIRVGAQSQNIGTGPIPASAFANNAFDTLFGGNTINVGLTVQVNLRLAAAAAAARTFAVSIIGVSVQG
jgi:hypothetical protein